MINMSESSPDLEPTLHAAHLSNRALSPMTISLDLHAVDRPNGSLRTANGPSYSAPPATSPSPLTDMNDPFNSRHYYDSYVKPSEVYHTARRVVPLY